VPLLIPHFKRPSLSERKLIRGFTNYLCY
jgi:hypothetical protein